MEKLSLFVDVPLVSCLNIVIYRHVRIVFPILIEFEHIPNTRHEIPTQEVHRYYYHLCDIQLDRVDDNCDVLLLLGSV